MRRNVYLAGVSAVAALAMPALGIAQAKPTGVSFRLGAFFPTNSLRDVTKATFAAGIELKLTDLRLGTASQASLSVSADSIGGRDFQLVPVLINVVVRQSEFYYTLGVGLGITTGNLLPTASTFAFCAGIGRDFLSGRTQLFVEGRYYGTSNGSVSGFAAFVGVRF